LGQIRGDDGGEYPFFVNLKEDLDRVVSRDFREFSFLLSLWVKAVYLAINAFSRSEGD